MDFVTATKTCLSKYADFSGRARRSEYWWFYLASVLILLVGLIIDLILGTYPLFYFLLALGLLVPSLAAGIRRFHDIGKPGVYILLGLIPFAGVIILIVFFVQDSVPGSNEYGPNPKGMEGGYGGQPGVQGQGSYGQPGGYGQPAPGQPAQDQGGYPPAT